MRISELSSVSPTHSLSLPLTELIGFCRWRLAMKKFLLRAVLVLGIALGASLAVLADTIHLKDGSVIRGQIISFKNEQFTIMVGSGARGRKSRITVYMEDVDSIEFDNAGNVSGPAHDNSSNSNPPVYQPPKNPQANK